jgi:filamentous hemagglutinin
VPVGVDLDLGGEPLLHLVTLEDTLGPEADGLLDPADPAGVRSDDAEDAPDVDDSAGITAVEDAGHTPAGVEQSAAPADRGRARGWKPGDYVFNLTQSGAEPAADTIRSRYWKNVANTRGTAMFGRGNTDRMAAGKPPERRNPRTGKVEVMRLPQVDHEASGGETPVPEWPTTGLDPFSGPTAE